jgi:hypothetical protein
VAAHAQHVVTEAEASKLTLEALTAATRFEHARGHGWRHGFERASYRAVSYRTTVSHHAARHHRHF